MLFLCFAISNVLLAQPAKFLDNIYYYIENISIFELNREEGRAYYMPTKNISLNGGWKFFYSETPEGVPIDFYTAGFSDKNWGTIDVPSNWEMQGYGDRIFRNVAAPFPMGRSDVFAVFVPNVSKEYNSIGAYRKLFTVPSSWNGDQVFFKNGENSFCIVCLDKRAGSWL